MTRCAGAAIALCLALAAPARADDDPDVEVARRRFQRGTKHYERREYAKALAKFEAARMVKPLPPFDFNIARCHDRMERYREVRGAACRSATSPSRSRSARSTRRRRASSRPTAAASAGRSR
jgi:hypothetical protein